MAKKKIDYFNLKVRFNDVMMRELGIDIVEDDDRYLDYLYDIDTGNILQIKEKFIKYCDYEYPVIKFNEIEMNLIENPRLTETLCLPFLMNFCKRKNIIFHSISQVPVDESSKGYFVMAYITEGQTKEIRSDIFCNESVRIFNLITKINKTSHMYRFNEFDVEFPKKK